MNDRGPGIAPIGVLGHYNLLEALDPSGPGELFRARDTMRGRTVIIRRLPSEVSPEMRRRIEASAEVGAQLSHPNIIRLFEIGDDDGRPYLVFEHLKGQSLRREMAGHVLRVRRAVQLAIQMADAVADAHAAGYLHAGLSPESVVITTKGHAKIPAHEFACRYGFDASSVPERLHDYPSPEEAAGHEADERSDVFSVGAILYEMLTARRPGMKGSSLPSGINVYVPPALDELTLRAVAPNPEKRYQNAREFVAELRRIFTMLDVQGSADDEDFALAAPTRRISAGAVAVLMLVGLAGLAWWFTRG
jgi:serine/threonine protein kinase